MIKFFFDFINIIVFTWILNSRDMTDTTIMSYIPDRIQKLLECKGKKVKGEELTPQPLSFKMILRNVDGVTKLQTRFVATTSNGQTIDVHDAVFSQKTEPLLLIRILLSLSQCGCCARHSHGLLTEQHNHCDNIPQPCTTDYICDCPCRHYLRNYYKLCYWVSKAPEAHNEADILAL